MTTKSVRAIAASGLSIYDPVGRSDRLFLSNEVLARLLGESLRGLDLRYPLRTRSKVLKTKICEALGYPVPSAFRRTRPRFPGQDFDVYAQKADNLQVWNQDIVPARRYVIVRLNEDSLVTKVEVVTGEVLARLDTTGKLTTKYQAKSRATVDRSRLLSRADTANVRRRLIRGHDRTRRGFLPIARLFNELIKLVGSVIVNPGIDQERNRGWALHQAVCQCVAPQTASDGGQFPDLPDQLLEIKLQTAPTIDLGLVFPDSTEPIADLPGFRHCDVRYAIFYGVLADCGVHLQYLLLATGADFFTWFNRFEGKVTNTKLQLHLPAGFFG